MPFSIGPIELIMIIILTPLAAVCIWAYFHFRSELRQKREDEVKDQRLRDAINNVLISDPITRDNIDILRETGSEYLLSAVDLRREQVAREERRRDEERAERRQREEVV